MGIENIFGGKLIIFPSIEDLVTENKWLEEISGFEWQVLTAEAASICECDR
jgi:hypothetical protein